MDLGTLRTGMNFVLVTTDSKFEVTHGIFQWSNSNGICFTLEENMDVSHFVPWERIYDISWVKRQ